jgi:hypothetical protein
MNYNINKITLKMAYAIRTEFHLKELGCPTDQKYEKQIYVKDKIWNPPPAPLLIETKLTEFEKKRNSKHAERLPKYKMINASNLTPIQANALKLLKSNKDFIIKPSDKNLGPAIMDTLTYVKQIFKDHLLTSAYKQLS